MAGERVSVRIQFQSTPARERATPTPPRPLPALEVSIHARA